VSPRQAQHVPHTERSWVIGELTWGDALMNQHGNRTRQQLSVVLYEFVEDTYMTEKSAARRRRMKAASHRAGAPAKRLHAKRKHHVVTSKTRATSSAFGEARTCSRSRRASWATLSRWVELAELNGLRDPRAITPGQVIRLP
jgi:hypothetical protein